MTLETLPLSETPASEAHATKSLVVPRRIGPVERWPRQLLFIVVALAIAGGYFWATHQYWVPAHPGVDQNGYLVGGRRFAETLSMGFAPGDPFAFVGRMWIGTPRGEFYPKYPLGYPLLIAGMFWIGGDMLGPWLTYWINPVCMAGALVGTFFLCRTLAGSFAGVIGMILMAASPVTLVLTNNPNSHASTVCCVVWGMYFLLQWWKRGGRVLACASGFLIGYAATIRYTEGLQVLPILLVAAFRMSDCGYRVWDLKTGIPFAIRNPKSALGNFLEPILLLASWAFPLVVLVCFNLHWFGALTGYDSTNESTGFSRDWFLKNWPTMLTQLNGIALFFVLPLAVMGLVRLWGRDGKLAAVLSAWILPTTLLYVAYYWAPDGNTTSYMRFVLTVMPALLACGVWYVSDSEKSARSRWSATLMPGVVGAIGGIVSLNSAIVMLENDQRTNLVLAGVAAQARSAGVDAGALVIADERLLHHLQFVVKDLHLYSPEAFNKSSIMRMIQTAQSDPDAPQGLQPARALVMEKTIGPMNDNDLIQRQNQIMNLAFAEHRKVFLIGPKRQTDDFRNKFLSKKVTKRPTDKKGVPVTDNVMTYDVKVLKSWDETSDLRRDRALRWAAPVTRVVRNQGPGVVVWQVMEVKAIKPEPASQPATTRSSGG